MPSKPKRHTIHKNYQAPDWYGTWLGYKISKFDRKNKKAIVTLTLREDHLSPAGRVHGGVVSGFLDFACGAAVFATMGDEEYCSTVELKVNYFRPLFSGDKLNAVATVVFRGNRLCVSHAFLYRGREKAPVAMATATFNIISKTVR
ncbi:MAG: PaaI family thioesterase [Bdellovibrionota bacterium]